MHMHRHELSKATEAGLPFLNPRYGDDFWIWENHLVWGK